MKKPPTVRETIDGHIYRARATAGPDDAGRWRWRRERRRGKRWESHGTLWASPKVAHRLLHELHRELTAEGPLDRAGTVLDLLRLWLAVQEQRHDIAASTVKGYGDAARRLIEPEGGLRDLEPIHLGPREAQAWLRWARSRWAQTSIAQSWRVLGIAWAWGQRQGDIPRQVEPPSLRVRYEPRDRYTPTPAEVDEVLQLLAQADGRLSTEATRRMVLLARSTGARCGELYRLRWGDVLMRDGYAELRVEGKTGRRWVVVSGPVLDLLALGGPAQEPVIGAAGRASSTMRIRLREAHDALGQRPWSWHALRRLAVDEMARAGVDIGTAAAMTGHSPKVMLTHYRRATLDDRRRAAEVLGGNVIPFPKRSRDAG